MIAKRKGCRKPGACRQAPSRFKGTASSILLMNLDLEHQQPSKFSPDSINSLELFFLSNQAIAVSLGNSFLWGKFNVLPLQVGASTIIF